MSDRPLLWSVHEARYELASTWRIWDGVVDPSPAHPPPEVFHLVDPARVNNVRGKYIYDLVVGWTVEDHLSGKDPAVLELYEAFDALITACGPAERAVTKTAIAFKGRVRGFAGVTPRQRSLAGFLDLMERVQEPPFTRASPYTQRLWVNRFVISSLDDFDDRFAARVAQAYAVGGGAHRR